MVAPCAPLEVNEHQTYSVNSSVPPGIGEHFSARLPTRGGSTAASKDGSHHIDLIRVDIGMAGTPPPTADSLRNRPDQLSDMATTIEQTLKDLSPLDHT